MSKLPHGIALAALTAGLSLTASGAQAQISLPFPASAGGGWQGVSPADIRGDSLPNKDRARRATRVAELIDSGHCDEARRVAFTNGDFAMARNAAAICYLRSHPEAASHAKAPGG